METANDILVVGNYCHDTLIHPHGKFEVLGGSASYISTAFVGIGLGHTVVAKVGQDFKYPDKVTQPPIISKTNKTTHFIDDYRKGARTACVDALCSPLSAKDLGNRRAKIGIACGVGDEIQAETLVKLREISDIVICDVQGLIRVFNWPSGEVTHRSLSETPFAQLLDQIDILKISDDEAKYVDLASLSKRIKVVITQEKDGCTVVDGTTEARIPAFTAESVDSTGAGDCFVAGLTYGLSKGLPLLEAARKGNYFGSIAVQSVGVPDFTKLKI